MLTVNAAEHPLMNRFHKPGDEKRSVVIVQPSGYEDWLSCRNPDEARSFLTLYPAAEMHAEPYPLPPRKARSTSTPPEKYTMLNTPTVDELMAEAFAPGCDPRSNEYKRGVRAMLERKINGKTIPLPYDPGTAQADAYMAGWDEGRRIWHELQPANNDAE
jgi:hypothetical protein